MENENFSADGQYDNTENQGYSDQQSYPNDYYEPQYNKYNQQPVYNQPEYTQQQTYNEQNPRGEELDWRYNLPPELQKTMQRFNSPETLAKAYTDALGLISKKVSDYSEQDWQNFASIQSQFSDIPLEPQGYEIHPIEDSEEKINTFTDEDVEDLKQIAHQMGLNRTQSQQLYNVINEVGNRIIMTQAAQAQEVDHSNLTELSNDWGKATEVKIRAVNNCINNILPTVTGVSADRIKEEIANNGLQHNAILNKIFAAIGELTMESSSRGYHNIAPMDAAQKLDQMKSSPDVFKIMSNPRHPMYNQTVRDFRMFSKIKNREI